MFTKKSKTKALDFLLRNQSFLKDDSQVPKYKQVADHIISNIGERGLGPGDKIPSINETSVELLISRDTVEKAFKNLIKRGIIVPVRGKGFYVASTTKNDARRVLLVFNKLSDHKKTIYNSFVRTVGDRFNIDLQIHASESSRLEKIIIESLGKYDHYVIMPHLQHETDGVRAAINKIPKDKLILLNKDMQGVTGKYGCVYEDFELDIHQSLYTCIHRIRNYKRLILIFPTTNHYCTGIKDGFKNFCEEEQFEYSILEKIPERVFQGELYIVIEESDLVEVIKKSASRSLVLGQHVGVIAYNDSPFKEILAGGISVLSTDFEQMGQTLATMIGSRQYEKVKNPFKLIQRKSI